MKLESIDLIVEKSSDLTRNASIVFYAICIYILLIIISTEDIQLLMPDSDIKLPIIEINLSLDKFYLSVPIILLTLHFNIIFQFYMHTQKIDLWKKSIEENLEDSNESFLQNNTYPFIFNYLYLSASDDLSGRFQRLIGILAIFFFPFSILVTLQHRFSDYHSILYTIFHFGCVFTDALLIFSFYDRLFGGLDKTQNEIVQGKFANTKLYKYKILNFYLNTFNHVRVICIKLINFFRKTINLKNFILILLLIILLLSLFNVIIVGIMNTRNYLPKRNYIEAFFYFPVIEVKETTITSIKPSDELIFEYLREGKSIDQAWLDFSSGINLKNRNLVYAIFDKSKLIKCDFRGANLSLSSLKDCNLSYADLSNSDIKLADFSHSVAKYANFGDSLIGFEAIFKECDLSDSRISFANLNKADFTGANLQRASINNSIIQMASFEYADLRGANVTGSTFFGSSFKNAKAQAIQSISHESTPGFYKIKCGVDMSFTDFYNADMTASSLLDAWFIGANFNQTSVMCSDLVRCNFYGANFQLINLHSSNLTDSDMTGVYIDGSNFINSTLQGVKLDSIAFLGNLITYSGYDEKYYLNEIFPYVKSTDTSRVLSNLKHLSIQSTNNFDHFKNDIDGYLSIKYRMICNELIPIERNFLYPNSKEAITINRILYDYIRVNCPQSLTRVDSTKILGIKKN